LPSYALVATLTLPLSLRATQLLLREADRPARLVPAIKQTILAANLHGLLLVAALIAAAPGIPT
jgi:1,4-dihydroxy-2-naphthoate octaprenyltransferase